jgi:LVIVD repeat
MERIAHLSVALAVAFALVGFAAVATADPGEGHGDEITVPPPSLPAAPPGADGMELLDTVDRNGSINSDLAFYRDLAFVGSYDGFRIVDISNPSDLQVVSDTVCRANQGDLSVFEAGKRLMLLQSIDRPVTDAGCPSADTGTIVEPNEHGVNQTRARFGFEGLRMFDVTDPSNPEFVKFFRTECGSHTHTVVPDKRGRMVHAYVASYPLLSQITPQVDFEAAGELRCDAPHSKISVVSIPTSNPEAGTVKKVALSSDTEFYDNDGPFHLHDGQPVGSEPAFQACHDFQAFLPRDIMAASCAGDAQYWDISNRGDPTSEDGEPHTHIQREVAEDVPGTPENERWQSFDFIHNATVTWDGQVVAFVDESGGGVQARCDGENTKRGFTFFYPLVEPGTPVDGFDDLMGTYVIPRPQGSEICVSHNGNVLPTEDGSYLQAQAFYQGGNSLVDFSDPANATEIAFADLNDANGAADSWSSYWYNDVMYVNGGLGARGGDNRGFEAYAVFDQSGERITTRDWRHLNPQTQEGWQAP